MFCITDRTTWTSYDIAGTKDLVLNQWSHIAGVRRGPSIEVWMDGELQKSLAVPVTAAVDGGGPVRINAAYNPVFDHFCSNAKYDDLQIYRGALTAEQIKWMQKNPGNAIVEAGAAK
jgi:hypothetical protein